jgi:hypothetical protein
MTDAQKRRIAVVASCRDANYIPNVPLAGSVEEGADGITWQNHASIRQGLIEFIFISSHGFKLYAQCLRFLRKYGYRIICEHTPAESFAVDGLIVATLDRGWPQWQSPRDIRAFADA